MAAFTDQMPVQPGNRQHASLLYHFDHPAYKVQLQPGFDMPIPQVFGRRLKPMRKISGWNKHVQWSAADWTASRATSRLRRLELELAPDSEEPARPDRPPVAEPAMLPAAAVETMVFAVSSTVPTAAVPGSRVPVYSATVLAPKARFAGFEPVPRAEEVAAFVQIVADASPLRMQPPALWLPQFGIAIQAEAAGRKSKTEFKSVPKAEEVAAFVQMAAAPSPAAAQPPTRQLPPLKIAAREETPAPQSTGAPMAPPEFAGFAPVPRAEEVAAFVQSSTAAEEFAPLAIALPAFDIAAAEENDLQNTADAVDVVECCQQFMPSLSAEPVWSFVAASFAGWAVAAHQLDAPGLPQFAVGEPFMPASLLLAKPAEAEAAEVEVLAHDTAEALPAAPAIALRSTDPIFDIALEAAPHVPALPAQPVESMPAAQIFEPAVGTIAAINAIGGSTLQAARCGLGHTPAAHEPQPVEMMVFSRSAAEPVTAIELRTPVLRFAQSAERIAAASETSTLPVIQSLPAAMSPAALEPVHTLALPAPAAAQVTNGAIPARSFVALEFFCHKPSATVIRNVEWLDSDLAILPPVFRVKPVFTSKPEEEVAPQKKAGKKPAMAEVFELTAAKKKRAASPATQYAIKAVAASLIVGAVLWFGMGAMRIGSQTPAVNRDVSLMADSSLTPGGDSAAEGPASQVPVEVPVARKQPSGAMAKLRQAITRRAAATVTDSFRNGMEAWGTRAKSWAPGWSRHPEGYVQPGQLAIFRPSQEYTDYHLEFFGQIDHKSMGWTVRSKDANNYYAMKVSVVDPGLRPIIAMVHYSVVGGKKSRAVETPLNVMVHNNKPFQVAVDVKGNRMVTSIDGQEVDTWMDDTLPAGGVGFFADAGEKARLYWMKISKNEDFLGRVCAYISSRLGDGTAATAELWSPEPFGRPAPFRKGGVDDTDMTLRAAFLVFPAFSRRAQRYKDESGMRRDRWNS